MSELAGATCLLTGATGGIGRELAARLVGRGAHLLASARDEHALQVLLGRVGGTALPADLTKSTDVTRLAAQAGAVDIVVCNAGVGWAGDLAAMPGETIEQLIALNLTAPIQLTRLLVAGMQERRTGHVVLVGSIAGATGVAREAVYSATKAGLAAFAESLRYEVGSAGVRVTLVVPGVIDTAFFARRGTPYDRAWPRPIRPARVAEATVRAIRDNRDEVVVPGWLRLPVRLRGMAPRTYRLMAGRFG